MNVEFNMDFANCSSIAFDCMRLTKWISSKAQPRLARMNLSKHVQRFWTLPTWVLYRKWDNLFEQRIQKFWNGLDYFCLDLVLYLGDLIIRVTWRFSSGGFPLHYHFLVFTSLVLAFWISRHLWTAAAANLLFWKEAALPTSLRMDLCSTAVL